MYLKDTFKRQKIRFLISGPCLQVLMKTERDWQCLFIFQMNIWDSTEEYDCGGVSLQPELRNIAEMNCRHEARRQRLMMRPHFWTSVINRVESGTKINATILKAKDNLNIVYLRTFSESAWYYVVLQEVRYKKLELEYPNINPVSADCSLCHTGKMT
jgi:hypothetical protein